MTVLTLNDPALIGRVSTPSGPPVASNLVAAWESDSITGLNDGDAVGTWLDTSGQNRHATQSTSSLKPLYKTNIFGSKPAVRFDGSDDVLTFTTSDMPDFSFFMVSKIIAKPQLYAGPLTWRGASHSGFVIWDSSDGGAWSPSVNKTNSSNAETFAKYTGIGHTPFPATKSIDVIRWNAGAPDITIYDPTPRNNGFGLNGYTAIQSGGLIGQAGFAGAYDSFNADIGAILVYNVSLSDANKTLVVTYLNNKYNIF